MRVIPVSGEPTRFRCESASLECCACAATFSRLEAKHAALAVGSKCPKGCGGTLDVRFHMVDVAWFHPVGRCSCEHWNFRLGPQVGRMTRAQLEGLTQQQARNLRCSHIEAARTAAIDIAIHSHERERGNGRQLEEKGP